MDSSNRTDFNIKLTEFLAQAFCVLFISAATMSFLEAEVSHYYIPFHSWLYFCVVTIATVGFGDIHPTNGFAELFCCLMIIAAIVFVPVKVTQLYNIAHSSKT